MSTSVPAALEGLQEKHPARLKTYKYESCNENGSSHLSVEEDGQAFDALIFHLLSTGFNLSAHAATALLISQSRITFYCRAI
jgi:hypothetical protein